MEYLFSPGCAATPYVYQHKQEDPLLMEAKIWIGCGFISKSC